MSLDPEFISTTTSRRAVIKAIGALSVGVAALMRPRPPVVRADDRPTVTVWTWQDSVGVKALEDVAASFNASQGDVQVSVVRRPAVITTFQLVNTIREGLGPDLCITGRGLLAERDAVGIWEDLSPYLADITPAIDLDDFQPFAAQEVRLGDRVVGIPLETTVRVLAMNRAMLAEAGIVETEWSPDRGPVTFDRLAEVARGLDRKNAQGAYEQVGYVPWFGEGSPYQYLHAWGAQYFDEKACMFTIDTPQARGAIGWVRSFLNDADGDALAAFMTERQGGLGAPNMPFLQGGIAFALVQDQDLRTIPAAGPDFDLGATFVPIPESGAASRSWATGNAISLLTGARNPEAAVRFIAYLTNAAVLEQYCLAIDGIPSRKHLSPELLKALARPAFVTDHVLTTAVPTPHVPIASHFQDLLVPAWSDMTSGQVEIDAGLQQVQKDADQALADDGATCT